MAPAPVHIKEIWRFPVKSMAGERVERAELTSAGLCGDRALALLDVTSGKIASAKNVRDFPDLMSCRARFDAPPVPDAPLPNVQITLPDGQTVNSHDPDTDQRLTAYFGRAVRLIGTAPDETVIDQYHPDLPGLNPAGNRDIVEPQPIGASLFRALGQEAPLAPGSLQDLFPLSLITTATLRSVSQAAPGADVEAVRFRMNILLDSPDTGPVENGWTGHAARLGAAHIHFAMPDPRCVMITRPTLGLGADTDILRAVAHSNRLDLPGIGAYPCAGVYAVVDRGGHIASGDILTLRG